jgi:hypothetical protein
MSIHSSMNKERKAVSPAGSKGGICDPEFSDRLRRIRTPRTQDDNAKQPPLDKPALDNHDDSDVKPSTH